MGFPEAPRRVRLRAAAAAWWPLGVTAGAALALVSVVILVLLGIGGFHMPFDDWALNSRGSIGTREGTVVAVRETRTHIGSRDLRAVEYTFDPGDGSERHATCYALQSRFQVGTKYPMEYLPETPGLQRLRGSAIAMATLWLPYLVPIWLGAFLVTGFWWSRAFRARVLLRNGRAVPGRVVSAVPTRFTNPPQLVVRYEYDAEGPRTGKQWLRRSGTLAQRIEGLPAGAAIPGAMVVRDEAHPGQSRLLADEDVLSTT